MILIIPITIYGQNQSNNFNYKPSDPCCPFTSPYYIIGYGCSWEYDGEKCVYDFGVDIDDFEMFFWENKLYVIPDCNFGDLNNHCCPDGFTFDGQNCYFDESSSGCLPHIIDNEDKWMYDDIYTEDGVLYLELECCECPLNELEWDEDPFWINSYDDELIPRSYYTGNENCKTPVEFNLDSEYFVWNNKFYVMRDCNLYTGNDCCPNGFTFNGWDACYYEGPYIPSGLDPSGEDWFVWDGALYFEADCCVDNVHTKADICDFMTDSASNNISNSNTFTMVNDDFINLSFTTFCVRDRIIITVNGNPVVDSGNFSSSACNLGACNSFLLQACGNDTFGCGNPFTASFTWNACDVINVQILADPCNDGGSTDYDIICN